MWLYLVSVLALLGFFLLFHRYCYHYHYHTTVFLHLIKITNSQPSRESMKEAGAELCHAQAEFGLPTEARFISTVEFPIWAIQGNTYSCCFIYFADFACWGDV